MKKRSNPKTNELMTRYGLQPDRLPQHVAIIMDGNGRWAKAQGKRRIYGHRKGADRVREIVRLSGELGISHLTLFAFSAENWSRPRTEVNAIMKLLNVYLDREQDELDANNVVLKVIGQTHRLPQANQVKLKQVCQRLAKNTGLTLTLALSYSGRTEILNACQRIVHEINSGHLKADALTDKIFESFLDTSDFPALDLLIRTSGEQRISNFLLWQLAYAELYFTETHWPEFNEHEFMQALKSYQQRERRFGNVLDHQADGIKKNQQKTHDHEKTPINSSLSLFNHAVQKICLSKEY